MSRTAFVVGWPVKHSRSPLIHRFWLRRHGLTGDYLPEAVPPEDVESFLQSAGEKFIGGNVTLPHKEAAFRACSRLTPVAERLAAVNTLWRADGGWSGDNTDAFGFAANLDDAGPDWRDGSHALVIGAGGASRAVIHALIEAGFGAVTVANRTFSRAEALKEQLGSTVHPISIDRVNEVLPDANVIVNASSAALEGEAEVWIEWHAARANAIATDLTYVPLTTRFLREAAAHGVRTVDGLGMLLHQAVPGFERWFGVRPVVDDELRALVVADLAG
jgi:shikimate dehydrogenase